MVNATVLLQTGPFYTSREKLSNQWFHLLNSSIFNGLDSTLPVQSWPSLEHWRVFHHFGARWVFDWTKIKLLNNTRAFFITLEGDVSHELPYTTCKRPWSRRGEVDRLLSGLKASASEVISESADTDQTPCGHISKLNRFVLELKRLWSSLKCAKHFKNSVGEKGSTWNFRALCLMNRLLNTVGTMSGKNLLVLASILALSEVRPNSWDRSVSRVTSVFAKWISNEEQSIQSIFGGKW